MSDEKKLKVYTDEVKQRHTSHWDLDYMSQEEIEEAYRRRENAAADEARG